MDLRQLLQCGRQLAPAQVIDVLQIEAHPQPVDRPLRAAGVVPARDRERQSLVQLPLLRRRQADILIVRLCRGRLLPGADVLALEDDALQHLTGPRCSFVA